MLARLDKALLIWWLPLENRPAVTFKMDIIPCFIVSLILNIITTLKSASATNRQKVTFLKINTTSIRPYCPIRMNGNFDKEKCGKLCAKMNYSCSAIEHSNNNCTLWKYVLFEKSSNLFKNLYLKDVSNTFDRYQCLSNGEMKKFGKCNFWKLLNAFPSQNKGKNEEIFNRQFQRACLIEA